MKRLIAGAVCAAMVGAAAFAQEVTFFNRLGSVLVTQAAQENAGADFGNLYNRIHGLYDSEKFSFFGRLQAQLQSNNGWDHHVELAAPILEFNGAIRPLEFLEIALGNSYGHEQPWAGYVLPGAYGYGSDVDYGRHEWADGEGLTAVLKADSLGVPGLIVGWNALPLQNAFSFGLQNNHDGCGWNTQVGVIYSTEAFGVGFGGKFSTRKWTQGQDIADEQQLGVYFEFLGVENMKLGAGVTMDLNSNFGFTRAHNRGDGTGDTFTNGQFEFMNGNWFGQGLGGAGQQFNDNNEDFVAFVNAGLEYKMDLGGMGLTLAADFGMYAGAQTLYVVQNGEDITVMPLLVGALVKLDLSEQLWFDLRGVYEDLLASGDYNLSQLTITPRVHFLLSESDEFRLQVPITTNFITRPEAAGGDRSDTGFNIEVFWQHNF